LAQVGPCILVRIQRSKAAVTVGPTSGPTWRLSHLGSGGGIRHASVERPEVAVPVGRPA
jgi:hypothetical protein